MDRSPSACVLPDVPRLMNLDRPDIFTDALCAALGYRSMELATRFGEGAYDAISGFAGRAWLIGFHEGPAPEQEAAPDNANFAFASLDAYLEHHQTLTDAIRFLDRKPEILWNRQCRHAADAERAAGLAGDAESADSAALRAYVTDYVARRGRPAIVLLHHPAVDRAEMALVTGYEDGGAVILGRTPYVEEKLAGGEAEAGPCGYFRLSDWEADTLAVIGVGDRERTRWPHHPCFVAVGNALRTSVAHSDGPRHYGLNAYDAWERALLDDAAIEDADDELAFRLVNRHSITAGVIACQKCFTRLPDCDDAPAMGVISSLVRRATSGPLMIHGLMWDAWQVVGGYWRVREDSGRFRDRGVRERAAAVVRRARAVDAQTLQDLADARSEWQRCLGRGNAYRCPCMQTRCARVRPPV